MLLEELARTSDEVASTPARSIKVQGLAAFLRQLRPEEAAIAVTYLSGELPQGTIGVGWASLRAVPGPAREPAGLTLIEVDHVLGRIAEASGPGSRSLRRRLLEELFARATEPEHGFLLKLLTGELRQGALGGVMVEAIARAAGAPAADVRRAAMVAGDLPSVASAALAEGAEGLRRFRLNVLQPIQPMLAQTASDLREAVSRISPAQIEYKLDGARLQVHRAGAEVRAFTRNLADVTARLPEVIEAVGRLALDSVVLDGEVIALREDGRPHPFQMTMSRFGSKLGVDAGRESTPLSPFFFDCLHLDGDDLIDRPAAERFAALADRVNAELVVPRTVTDDPARAEAWLAGALERGHEGVMVKALDAPYEAGRRGAGWLKVKRAHTLDLVVLAAEWGHGRRRGWLSNLHLGARAEGPGAEFVMLGKTFKGMTDEMLKWQTARLLELETERSGITVFVRPQLVVEVAFDGVQASVRYPGGVALRFARVKGYRLDKTPDDVDTIETVRAIHEGRM